MKCKILLSNLHFGGSLLLFVTSFGKEFLFIVFVNKYGSSMHTTTMIYIQYPSLPIVPNSQTDTDDLRAHDERLKRIPTRALAIRPNNKHAI